VVSLTSLQEDQALVEMPYRLLNIPNEGLKRIEDDAADKWYLGQGVGQ
jgi:hypothetical protein